MMHMILRNAVGRKARRPVRRAAKGRTTSAAIRRKISLAVKAANRRRAAGGAKRTVAARPASRPVARRANKRRTMAMAASRSSSVASRRVIRRSVRRSTSGGSSMNIKGIFSKENMTMAGGAFAASFLTTMVLNKFSEARNPAATFKLPFTKPTNGNNIYGEAVYGILIPVAGAFLVRKSSPAAAKGMIVSGIFNLFNSIANFVTPPAAPTAPRTTGEYVRYSPPDNRPAITFGNPPGFAATNMSAATGKYSTMSTGRMNGPFDSAPAFRKTW